jgi:hypothetical protein
VLHEPVLNYDFKLPEAATKRGWQSANNYCMWVGLRTPDEPAHQLLVRPADKILFAPLKDRQMNLIPAGCAYRVTHLFAPWRLSDADTIHLRVVEPEGIYTALLTAMSQIIKQDHLLWICPSCGHEIAREAFDTRKNGLIAFWPFQLERVRAANARPATCPQCHKAHPMAYGFERDDDTPQEAAARKEW